MAAHFSYKEDEVWMNNRGMNTLIDLVMESVYFHAEKSQYKYIDRLKKLWDEEYWNGRGFTIEEDFVDIEECKFWYIAFSNHSRYLFDRKVGNNDASYWQANQIYLSVGVAQLFLKRIDEEDPKWNLADHTINDREFRTIYG